MTADRRQRLFIGAAAAVAAVAALALAVSGTGEDGSRQGDPPRPAATADPAPTAAPVPTRPPLDDPPDPGPAPDHHGLSEPELAAAVESSVRVSGLSCNILREGSGFAVHDGNVVVTNAHLLLGLHEPEVELADGRVLEAVPVAFDAVNDLALLRVPGAGLHPLPLFEAVPDGTVGAVLAWEAEAMPEPTPFRIDRPVTARTDIVGGDERIERPSWLLAARTESGDSGAALVAPHEGRIVAVGVAWAASRRSDADVSYATRSGVLEELLASSDLHEPAELPDCR